MNQLVSNWYVWYNGKRGKKLQASKLSVQSYECNGKMTYQYDTGLYTDEFKYIEHPPLYSS